MHWSHKQLTLFISIVAYLVSVDFFATTGKLKEGSEVTVEAAGAEPFWARVVELPEGDSLIYKLEDEDSKVSWHARGDLRWRNKKTIAFAFATGDRKHDTHAVQHFLIKQQEWLKANVPGENFTKFFLRSDNAASHFKSKYTLRFLSFFKAMFGFAHVVWDFGCPGHGKGPWDGIAGMLKSWLRRTALEQPMDKVDRGPKDCADRLRDHFETDKWREDHSDGTINQIVVPWTPEDVIQRPSHYERSSTDTVVHSTRSTEVAPLKGATQNYSYCMLGDGRVGVRRYTCWCKACLGCNGRIIEEGTAAAPTARVDGCASVMRRVHLELTDAAGARRTRAMRFNSGESIARDLKEAAVFACATPAHGYQDEFELFVAAEGPRGRVIETLPADQEINGINFKKGRLLVYCHDLARVHEDPDRRSFVLEPTLRAVEARMVRRIGVVLEDARAAPTLGGVAPVVPQAFRAFADRIHTISDDEIATVIAACDG